MQQSSVEELKSAIKNAWFEKLETIENQILSRNTMYFNLLNIMEQ